MTGSKRELIAKIEAVETRAEALELIATKWWERPDFSDKEKALPTASATSTGHGYE